MGQSQSGEINVHVYETSKRDIFAPLVYILINFVFVGFVIGVIYHEQPHSMFYLGRGFDFFRVIYLLIHVASWYIIYSFVYMYIIEIAIKEIAIHIIQFRYEKQITSILEFLYGWWAAYEILDGWIGLLNYSDCLLTSTCKGLIQVKLMSIMESMCEYFGAYDYHAGLDIYIREPNNFCHRIFHLMPKFLSTVLSCVTAYFCLTLAAPTTAFMTIP